MTADRARPLGISTAATASAKRTCSRRRGTKRPSKAYLTFAELAGLIGFLGMEQAISAFATHRLLCVDEFELDDIAQTLMTVTFLRAVIGAGTRVVATSNALPDRLGEGRFAADDFTRRDRGDRIALRGRSHRRTGLPGQGQGRGRAFRRQ